MNAPIVSPRNVLTARSRLGEAPLWDESRQVLYWVDIYNHRVHQFDPTTGSDRWFEVGDVVGCLALASEERLLMAQRDRLAFLHLQTGAVVPILDLETEKPKNRFNDGKCDPQGRFWFGSISAEPGEASLYRYDPDGSLRVMEAGLTISNGLGWSPDQTTFYLADSGSKCIYAYDFEPLSGTIANRRTFIDFSQEPFTPDGLALDQDGYLWVALWDGWSVIRVAPTGEAVLRVPVPVQRPTCCTFGGVDRRTLYITTASVGLSEAEIAACLESGDLFSVRTEAIGMPTTPFGL